MLLDESLFKLLIAVAFGGLIGLERQYHHKVAGFRTMIMISLGSCLFMILSDKMALSYQTDRIAANVVTGIGFLGAGVIFRSANRVSGITTAAAIWAVAAGGMAIGAGYYVIAACTVVLILAVLAVLPYAEARMDARIQYTDYTILLEGDENDLRDIKEMLRLNNLKFKTSRHSWSPGEILFSFEAHGKPSHHTQFIKSLKEKKGILKIDYR